MKHGNKSIFKKNKGSGTIPPVRASIIDNRTNITTIKLLNLICLKNIVPKQLVYNPIVHLVLKRTSPRYIY